MLLTSYKVSCPCCKHEHKLFTLTVFNSKIIRTHVCKICHKKFTFDTYRFKQHLVIVNKKVG